PRRARGEAAGRRWLADHVGAAERSGGERVARLRHAQGVGRNRPLWTARDVKLAVIGAGSTYTPEVIDGIVRLRHLMTVDDLYLHDTNEQRLNIVSGLAQRMFDRAAHPTRLHSTTSLDDAVEGADAVLIQIRVGGQ